MKAQIYRWHRCLGLVTFAFVIIWALSGIVHPIMVWTSPHSAQFMPPADQPDVRALRKTLPEILKLHGIKEIEAFRLRAWRGRTFYQVRPQGQWTWIFLDAETGERLPDGDRDYAVYLARYYAAEPTAIVSSVELLTEFSREFVAFNQLLPVYKVTFDRPDALRVYVDTETGMLGDMIDRRKGILNGFSRRFMCWSGLSPLTPCCRVSLRYFFPV